MQLKVRKCLPAPMVNSAELTGQLRLLTLLKSNEVSSETCNCQSDLSPVPDEPCFPQSSGKPCFPASGRVPQHSDTSHPQTQCPAPQKP